MPDDPLRPLLDGAAEGDGVALRELVRRTQSDVWRLCSALGSPGEEDDLVQETYLRAFRAMSSFRGESTVRVWLLAIGRRVCADHVRRRQRQRRLIERLEPASEWVGGPGADVSVTELLDHISPERREAFVLTQLLGLRYDEAAEALGCPIGTIRSRVARARAELAELVDRSQAV